MKKIVLLMALVFTIPLICNANAEFSTSDTKSFAKNPYYAGLTLGYGASTWQFLIPPDPNDAITLSTPTNVNEGGVKWGFVAGYEYLPQIALEFSYDHYPQAQIVFDDRSLFSFDHDDLTDFYSDIESYALIMKIMYISAKKPDFRIFSSAGPAMIHRDDILLNKWLFTGRFNIGCDFLLTEHTMLEFYADYTAGDGVSELNPADHFVPFLYSLNARFILRI